MKHKNDDYNRLGQSDKIVPCCKAADETLEANIEQKESLVSKWKIFKGIVFSILTGILYVIGGTLVKEIQLMPIGQITLIRWGFVMFPNLVVAKCKHLDIFPKKFRLLLLFRGITTTFSSYLGNFAYRHLPLLDATIISFSFPMFTGIGGKIFLNEPFGVCHFFLLLLTLVGLGVTAKLPVMIANAYSMSSGSSVRNITNTSFSMDDSVRIDESFDQFYYLAVGAAFSSTILTASSYVITRKIKGLHASVIGFNTGLVGTIQLIGLCLVQGMVFNPVSEILLSFGFGCVKYFATLCIIIALQSEQTILVTICECGTSMAFSYLIQLFFFAQMPDIWSDVGAVIIFISLMGTTWYKWNKSRKK